MPSIALSRVGKWQVVNRAITIKSELEEVPRVNTVVENEGWWDRTLTLMRAPRIGKLGVIASVFIWLLSSE